MDFKELIIKTLDKASLYQMEEQGYLATSVTVAHQEEKDLLIKNLKEGLELTVLFGNKKVKVVVCGVDDPQLIKDQWRFPYRIRLN